MVCLHNSSARQLERAASLILLYVCAILPKISTLNYHKCHLQYTHKYEYTWVMERGKEAGVLPQTQDPSEEDVAYQASSISGGGA